MIREWLSYKLWCLAKMLNPSLWVCVKMMLTPISQRDVGEVSCCVLYKYNWRKLYECLNREL